MKTILGYKSSSRIWRASARQAFNVRACAPIPSADELCGSPRAIPHAAIASEFNIPAPLDILVFDSATRRKTANLSTRTWGAKLHPESLCALADVPGTARDSARRIAEAHPEAPELLVSSPQFCFLQAATKETSVSLMQYGMELCGTYAAPGQGLKGRKALLGKDSLDAYLKGCGESPGLERALHAMKWVLPNSASPMETRLALKLTLPLRYGGWNMPQPILNYEVPLDEEAAALVGKRSLRFDLFWPDAGLAVEYDSEQEHTGRDRIARDAIRRNVIDYLGYHLVVVTPDQFFREQEFGKTAFEIAHRLGIRVQKPKGAAVAARANLHRELMPRRSKSA